MSHLLAERKHKGFLYLSRRECACVSCLTAHCHYEVVLSMLDLVAEWGITFKGSQFEHQPSTLARQYLLGHHCLNLCIFISHNPQNMLVRNLDEFNTVYKEKKEADDKDTRVSQSSSENEEERFRSWNRIATNSESIEEHLSTQTWKIIYRRIEGVPRSTESDNESWWKMNQKVWRDHWRTNLTRQTRLGKD